MHLSPNWRLVTVFSLATAVSAVLTAGFKAEDIITRDVCILGGGATGTYAAVQLREQGHSIALVEKKDRMGGHAETLYLPNGEYVNYGVEGYFNNDITKDFFNQLDVDYEPLLPGSIITENVNFNTGERVLPGNEPITTAAAAVLYRTAIEQFDYLASGAYYLPDEVPEVLLRPFREFVEAHALQGAMDLIFMFAENLGDLLEAPLLYVIQNFGITHINALLGGGYIRPKNGTDELFSKAANYIDEQNIFYETTVSRAKRNSTGVEMIVQSADGSRKLIKAKKLLITFPPTLSSLSGFDLRKEESSLFAKWRHMNYYAAAITNTGLPDGINVANTNPDNQPGSLPLPPFQWELEYSGVPGYFMTKIVAEANFTTEDAKDLIKSDLKRMGETGAFSITEPEIAAFASHSPETLIVDVNDVRDGFYRKLYALQGQQSTYYTGYTFCTDYSTPLWNYTSSVLDMMNL
jgi:beta-cyclopiazonate dehydrogenase